MFTHAVAVYPKRKSSRSRIWMKNWGGSGPSINASGLKFISNFWPKHQNCGVYAKFVLIHFKANEITRVWTRKCSQTCWFHSIAENYWTYQLFRKPSSFDAMVKNRWESSSRWRQLTVHYDPIFFFFFFHNCDQLDFLLRLLHVPMKFWETEPL